MVITEQQLFIVAKRAYERAYPWKSGTKVGCVILTEKEHLVLGWNVEGRWMTSIHAEVCAVLKLAALRELGKKVVIVSDTNCFTPCGACIDWLFQFCHRKAEIVIQNKDKRIFRFILEDLCPHYPQQ